MNNILEKLNNLALLHNENNLLNNKINKLKQEKTRPDEKKKAFLQQRKNKIKEDLLQLELNDNKNNIIKTKPKLTDKIPELSIGNIETYVNLTNIEDVNNTELITSILKDNDILPNRINNKGTNNRCNTYSNSYIMDKNDIKDDNNNIEIGDEIILQLFKSNSFQDLNNNLKKL